MKKLLLLLILGIGQISLFGQTSSVYHVETEFTPLNGYRYYFDKLDPQTGNSVRLATLPVQGFYSGYSFFNCFGHYVFQGIDTLMPSGNYLNKLYELDTLGNIIRTLPMDTVAGTWYKVCLPSAGSPYYYALRWNTTGGQWVLETIDAINGSRTVQTLPQLVNYNYWNSDATITRDDVLWFGMDNQILGASVLISVDPSTGLVGFEDTLSVGGYYYDCLNYDCANDTIYGFVAHMDSVNGAELIKVNGASGTVIYSGRTAVGSGIFNSGTHTRLANRRFYVRTSILTYLLPDFYVSAPTFIMPVTATPSSPSTFCFAAPRESCSFFSNCQETAGIITDFPTDQLTLFPNPVTDGILNVKLEGNFSLELIDISGRVVFSNNGGNLIVVPVYGLASGIYAVRIQQDQNSIVRRFIISN